MTSGPTINLTIPARWIAITAMMLAILPSTGCRICDSSGDLDYPTYGGAWQRTIRESGRVGSLFDPAGGRASELVSRDQPITADEIERNRRDAEGIGNDDPSVDESDEPSDDEPNNNQSRDELRNADPDNDPIDPDRDDDVEKLKQELRDKKLDEVKVIPGDLLPPLLR